MTLAGVNVLIAAFRPDHVHHQRCRAWLDNELRGPAFGVAPQILAAVVRVSTNPRVFANPSMPAEALAFSKALLEWPSATIVSPGPQHWGIFDDLVRTTPATGNLVTDAWFAALAIEWGCTLVTLDRDFALFAGLQTAKPKP